MQSEQRPPARGRQSFRPAAMRGGEARKRLKLKQQAAEDGGKRGPRTRKAMRRESATLHVGDLARPLAAVKSLNWILPRYRATPSRGASPSASVAGKR